MPMNSQTEFAASKEVINKSSTMADAVDNSGKAAEKTPKKSSRSLTSFSIFRSKDKKKFCESKINSPSEPVLAKESSVAGGRQSTKSSLVLDNTRQERRLQKELMAMIKEPPPGVSVDSDIGSNLSQWVVHIQGVEGTLYEGEAFQLLFKFNDKYPFDSPEVTFIGTNIPIHPHVYSNGHICLSILTEDWSPALSVLSVCLSISSMLSSCREKKRPPDNTFYVKTCNKNPKKTKWWYHDDSV